MLYNFSKLLLDYLLLNINDNFNNRLNNNNLIYRLNYYYLIYRLNNNLIYNNLNFNNIFLFINKKINNKYFINNIIDKSNKLLLYKINNSLNYIKKNIILKKYKIYNIYKKCFIFTKKLKQSLSFVNKYKGL
jgi:hypothetical protein